MHHYLHDSVITPQPPDESAGSFCSAVACTAGFVYLLVEQIK